MPQAIKVVYSAGLTPVPDDVQLALSWAVTLLMNQRRLGMPVTNESWNGYSRGVSPQYTATSALLAPGTFEILKQYYARAYCLA